MTYKLEHVYVDQGVPVSLRTSNDIATARCSLSGNLRIRFPGSLHIFASAIVLVSSFIDGKLRSGEHLIPLTLEIKKPDGRLFTANHITLDDLNEFRDLRGTSQGEWTYEMHGESAIRLGEPLRTIIAGTRAQIRIAVEETVASQSAPPLVNDTLQAQTANQYMFDLFRVGLLTATAAQRRMALIDPDGVAIATGNGHLTFPVTLETIDKSRDAEGKVRPWSLQVSPSFQPLTDTKVFATVIETARIHTNLLKNRIDFLIGEHGSKLSIFGEMTEDELLVRLTILDKFSAETIDMHNLLNSVIESVEQDESVDTNIRDNVPYTLARIKRDLGHECRLDGFTLQVNSINIGIGASEEIEPALPALKVKLDIIANVEVVRPVVIGVHTLATAKIRDNQIRLEAGLRLQPDGSFAPETRINEDVVDLDAGTLLSLFTTEFEIFEHHVNEMFSEVFLRLAKGIMGKVPQILAVMLGDDFTYRSLHLDGDDIVFDYVAPVEPEPKPSKKFKYLPVIGRSATELGPGIFQFFPVTLGDTWKAENLKQKIDHIVVVIMENRSFDHVLGYIAQSSGREHSDGLTDELMNFLKDQGFPVGKLKNSGIPENSQHFKTRFPLSVGHELADVTQQLKDRLITPSSRAINSPKGFVDNFAVKHGLPKDGSPMKPEDVLGFYDDQDLAFYDFLVKNYAYCERYFCSHPGPTLPNRMFSLTGDVQYDRTGEAVLDNNDGDNFSLSRAMTTFDLLTRKRVGWRVYESFPSVTMLRMFARYTTDNTNIVDISRLPEDVALGNLPSVAFVEPAMHHAPENDDHSPFADMYRGQLFLKFVYDSLRSNAEVWRKTMLVITYDEHGGFYDHVIPPLADILVRPPEAIGDIGGGGHFTSSVVKIIYGPRVPTFVVSPWAPVGKGPDIALDHCSIIKTILARFLGDSKPFVSNRVNSSRSFDAYLSESEPRMNVLASPSMNALEPILLSGRSIVTGPISRKQMRSGNVDYHDLTGMLARMIGR